ADLVGDLLGVAADRRLLERVLVAEREQVFADALVELVLRGRDADGIGDQVGLGAEEPTDRLAEIVARLPRGVGDVDDLVHGDVAPRVRPVRFLPRCPVRVEVLPEGVPRRERGRREDLELHSGGEGERVGGDRRGPEGRVRLLDGLGQDAEVAYRIELTLERDALLSPRAADDLPALGEPLACLRHREGETVALLVLVAAPETDLDAPGRADTSACAYTSASVCQSRNVKSCWMQNLIRASLSSNAQGPLRDRYASEPTSRRSWSMLSISSTAAHCHTWKNGESSSSRK